MPATTELYDFPLCSGCESKVGLMSETTFQKHCQHRAAFEKEAKEKLAILEKEYVQKKIKLMDILRRLGM
jgi:hypothetical protein